MIGGACGKVGGSNVSSEIGVKVSGELADIVMSSSERTEYVGDVV